MIQFAEFAPDKSVFDPNACDRLENVLPAQNGFGPFPGFLALTGPLPARPQGAFLANAEAGQYVLFAGTAGELYRLDPATLGWVVVSGTGAPFSTPDSQRWSFVQYGNWVLASNGVDPIQYYDLTTPVAFQELSANAPPARFIGVLGDFVFGSNLSTGNKNVAWSGLNNPQWWIPRQRSSDIQPFPDGGEIMGFTGFEKGCLIFHENCIREGALALDTALIMTFRKTVENHGCVAPKSIITTGAGIFYLSQDGFYRYGAPPVAIGNERVDKWFLDDIATEELYDVYGSEDPTRKIVYWAYRSRANPEARSFDKALVYNYGTDKWSLLLPGTYLTGLIEATTPGYTLDSLDDLGIPLDELPYSLDSRAWAGGSPTLAAFDDEFRLGFFSAEPLQAVMQTGDVALATGRRTFVQGFRPLTDAPQVLGRIAIKDRAGQPRIWKGGEISTPLNRTGLVPTRASGRFHSFEITIPAGLIWNDCHGVEPVGTFEGEQ